MSTIHFIGGEKGGVGKSVVARLCAQYCIDRSLPFAAVDADASHGALQRFYAQYTRSVDLGEYESVDQILTLATEQPRRVLVDLPGAERIACWPPGSAKAGYWNWPPKATCASFSGTSSMTGRTR